MPTIRQSIEYFTSYDFNSLTILDQSSVDLIGGVSFGYDTWFSDPIDAADFIGDVEAYEAMLDEVWRSYDDVNALGEFLQQTNPSYYATFLVQQDLIQAQYDSVVTSSNPSLWDHTLAEFSILETAFEGIATSLYNAIATQVTEVQGSLSSAANTIGAVFTPTGAENMASAAGLVGVAAAEFAGIVYRFNELIDVMSGMDRLLEDSPPLERIDLIQSVLAMGNSLLNQAERVAGLFDTTATGQVAKAFAVIDSLLYFLTPLPTVWRWKPR